MRVLLGVRGTWWIETRIPPRKVLTQGAATQCVWWNQRESERRGGPWWGVVVRRRGEAWRGVARRGEAWRGVVRPKD